MTSQADGQFVEASSAPHIGVIGAGISGLRCAALLIEAGFKVTILEARDRIGGRIWQSNDLGYPADMGPNWIYTSSGEEQCIMKLARKTGTPLHLWGDDLRLFDSKGDEVDAEKASELQETIWSLFKDSFGYATQHANEILSSASLYQYVRERIARLDVSDDDRELLVHFSHLWGNYTGSEIQRQSLKYVWTEVVCGGDEYFVNASLGDILREVAAVPLARADLQLSTKVVGIRSSEGRTAGRSQVTVLTHSGAEQGFDEVVVTLPLGCLKRGNDLFDPPLAPGLTDAIDSISVGHLEKVYITFPSAFWRSTGKRETQSPDHVIWLTPRYAKDTNPFSWPLEAYDLSALESENSHATLLIYTFGELSAHICSLVHENPDRAKQYAALDEFFRPYYSRMSCYNPKDQNCTPKAYLASTWRYDEFAGYGSYCNMQVGVEGADKHIQAFQDGIPGRGLWFAGEHAAPVEERGTVGGAYMSAEIAAAKIVAKHERGARS
ncbi:hypothetical protein GE09DRAFT_302154 [Coniochaeta sp. 2T2.1]|nr:hypothetical protein GE09DRAFT_302154 [Coniochaeta sp. 2T2.1]